MKLDDEVPFEHKSIFKHKHLEDVVENPPFPVYDGKFYISKIHKTNEYLSTDEDRNRLLLNILTSNTKTISGDSGFDNLKSKAWQALIRVVYSSNDNKPITKPELIKLLSVDPKSQESGKS